MATALDKPMAFDPAAGIAATSSVSDYSANAIGWFEGRAPAGIDRCRCQGSAGPRTAEALSNETGVNVDRKCRCCSISTHLSGFGPPDENRRRHADGLAQCRGIIHESDIRLSAAISMRCATQQMRMQANWSKPERGPRPARVADLGLALARAPLRPSPSRAISTGCNVIIDSNALVAARLVVDTRTRLASSSDTPHRISWPPDHAAGQSSPASHSDRQPQRQGCIGS